MPADLGIRQVKRFMSGKNLLCFVLFYYYRDGSTNRKFDHSNLPNLTTKSLYDPNCTVCNGPHLSLPSKPTILGKLKFQRTAAMNFTQARLP